ncbi:MAG: exosortase H [Pseudomonadota bacterium]
MLKFFLLFLAILLSLFAFELTSPAQKLIVSPVTATVAKLSVSLITVFDSKVIAYDNVIQNQQNGFAVSIQPGCNAIEACIVLIAAMLAFSAPWRHKLKGLVLGIIAVQVVNIARIISLFYIGQWRMDIFDFAHLYLWQALIMLDVLVVFLIWLRAMPIKPTVQNAA